MTNDTNPRSTAAASKSPSHTAYQVRDGRNGKGFWTRIGSAWPHADAQGFNVQLDCLPLDGRITLRVVSEQKDQPGAEPQ